VSAPAAGPGTDSLIVDVAAPFAPVPLPDVRWTWRTTESVVTTAAFAVIVQVVPFTAMLHVPRLVEVFFKSVIV
jgi:hypothetical protein